jgi:hypothetical protein
MRCATGPPQVNQAVPLVVFPATTNPTPRMSIAQSVRPLRRTKHIEGDLSTYLRDGEPTQPNVSS